MITSPTIAILDTGYGVFPDILPLNPAFREGMPFIKVTLQVSWANRGAVEALRELESQFASLSPVFQGHQCRGPHAYRVFVPESDESSPGESPAERFDPALALAHLMEHVMIGAVAYVTGSRTISGVTAGHAHRHNLFDVFVECPAQDVADLAAALAQSWVAAFFRNGRVNGAAGPVLRLARHLHHANGGLLEVEGTARVLDLPEASVEQAFSHLEAVGYVCRDRPAFNFSNLAFYRRC